MTDKPRSVDQHRRLFGLIRAAYDQWPEWQKFQPDGEEHLRAWLLVKAKHRRIHKFSFAGDAGAVAPLIPAITLMMLQKYSWAWPLEDAIAVCVPESIAFDKLSHAEACKVFDDVEDVLRREAKLEADELLKESA
ncbi:MAG: hypothetical protein AB1781_11075 [Pseudomonadota bacterium]